LLFPQSEWPESALLINRCGKCTEQLRALERGLWAYLACDCLILGYDKRLYDQRDLIVRWKTWRGIQNRLLSVLQE
jgi:hypothetical protein